MTKRQENLLALLTGVVLFCVYASTGARHVLGGDNGEFASIFAHGGVPHPSGYPAYALILAAFRWLPYDTPAGGAAFVNSLIGVAAFTVLRVAALSWGASRTAATLAAAAVALSSLVWIAATHAEVFALHALLGASVLALSGPLNRRPPVSRALLLGLVAGCGLSNNLTIVTLAPIGLYGVWHTVSNACSRARTLAAGAVGLLVGLSPYLWLYRVALTDPPLAWGNIENLGDLWRHATRADYGTVQLAISESGTAPLGHVLHLLGSVVAELHYVPILLVALGVATLFADTGGGAPSSETNAEPPPPRPRPPSISSELVPMPLHRRAVRATMEAPIAPERIPRSTVGVPRLAAISFILGWLLAGPVLVGLFNLPVEGLALKIIERFYVLPLVLCAVPLARGIDRVAGARLSVPDVAGPLVVGVVCLAIFLSLERVREHHRPDVEHYLLNTLSTATEGAVILGTGDHRLYGFWYAQSVLGRRTDVVYIDPKMLMYPWYQARITETIGAPLAGVGDRRVNTLELAAQLMRYGRDVYLTNQFSDAIVRSLPTYPYGTLIRVLPPGAALPSPEELEALNVGVAMKYRYATSAPRDPNGWAAYVQKDHTRPWQVLADAYESMGRASDAARARSRFIVVNPRSP